MRKKLKAKYPLEYQAEMLFIELRRFVRKGTVFFFSVPKKKMDRIPWMIEIIAWLFLTTAIILRIGK